MPCYTPLPAEYSGRYTKTGKFAVNVYSRTDPRFVDGRSQMKVPCGQCIGCRLDYSREWAVRCMHESQLYEPTVDNPNGRGNCFITLTYNDEFLPPNGSLNYRHWTLFMKRLRKRYGSDIRFYMGPEYGELSGRPHYHALLFNFSFDDMVLFSIRNGNRLYRSASLDSLWSCPKSGRSYGFASVGTVTFESAAYVARYMMKKVKGDDHMLRYFTQVDLDTGEIIPIAPEKARMSRMPGIARDWFDLYSSELYPSDEVVLSGGRKCMPPSYYDRILEQMDPDMFHSIKSLRVDNALANKANSTPDRLAVRLKCKEISLKSLPRPIDL